MKLLECHIAGFGAFSNYRLTFEDGLNVILQPNGWGKTTLAAYIKAMLYGFGRKRVSDVSENERLRYLPWRGGKFGGTLDFELDGKPYRILREFGRTISGDTCKVADLTSGKYMEIPGGEVGEWIFGLDVAAFQRSVFVSQDGFGFDGSTAGLRNRLNALVNEADDVAGLDKALAALDVRRKHYKKSGDRGRIAELSSDVARLAERRSRYDQQIEQMAHLHEHMAHLDERVVSVADQLKKAQTARDAAQGGEKELQALMNVHEQLSARRDDAIDAHRAFVARAGKIPEAGDFDTARKAVETIARLDGEASAAEEIIASVVEQQTVLCEKWGGKIPDKEEIEEKKRQLAQLAHQMQVVGLARPDASADFEAADAAVAIDAGLLQRADSVVSAWSDLEIELLKAEAGRGEVEAADAKWNAVRGSVGLLQEDCDRAWLAVPKDAESKASLFEKTASILHQCMQGKQGLEVRIGSLQGQIEAARSELGFLGELFEPGDDAGATARVIGEADLAKVDERIENCKAMAEKAVGAKREAEAEKSRVQEARADCERAVAALRDAQARFAEAQSAKAEAVVADAEARAAKAAVANGSNASPILAIACFFAAAVAVVIGFMLGPVAGVSFAAYAVAAIVLVAGVALLAKRSKDAGRAKVEAVEMDEAAKAAAEGLEKAEAHVAQTERERDDAAAADVAARAALAEQESLSTLFSDALRQAVSEEISARDDLQEVLMVYFPEIRLAVDAAVAQALVYREKLSLAASKQRLVIELEEKVRSLKADSLTIDYLAAESLIAVDLKDDFGGDYMAAAEKCAAAASSLSNSLAYAIESDCRLRKAMGDALSKDPDSLDADDIALFSSDSAPGMDDLKACVDAVGRKVGEFKEELRPLMKAFDVPDSGKIAFDVERLSAAVAARRKRMEQKERWMAETAAARKDVDDLIANLDAWALNLGLGGHDVLTDQVFESLSDDAAIFEKLEWERSEASARHRTAREGSSRLSAGVRKLLAHCGISTDDVVAGVAELSARAEKRDKLAREVDMAASQLIDWEKENASKLDAARRSADEGRLACAEQEITALQKQRETLLAERSQCKERRDAILRESEGYLALTQEIKLKSQEKQDAVAKLFTVQTTSAYLRKARENLDARYLGGLTDRFNDYAETWLKGETLDAVVGDDFRVTVMEDGEFRDAAGYSTGYRDLLDLCLRMALIDTVFEGEEPFVVMDDPFVNLDQEKIGRALMLLRILAKDRQIIYFTCHPSRRASRDSAIDAAANGADAAASVAEFALPPQRAPREMPRAHARREAEERARAQAELAASYHVEPVTQGRALVQVEGDAHAITSNLLSVRFSISPEGGARDNSFDVHFIDEKGRALCERQMVEVVNGCVVPEVVRFCLATRSDSGSVFDLVVHEQDRDQAVLAARVPYKADISFNTEDFGF